MILPSMLAALAVTVFSVLPIQTETGTILLDVRGFENAEGKARILLFSQDGQDDFPSDHTKALKKFVVPIEDGSVLLRVRNIPYGDYAISVHHDENDDGKVNSNWMGIPNEGLGASNNATGFFGPPSFEDAAIELDRETITAVIDMVN